MAQTVQRINYHTGLFLEQQEFQLEQDYHLLMRRRLNFATGQAGVLYGMGLNYDGTDLVVEPGMAIDEFTAANGERLGREIVLLQRSQPLNLNGFNNGDQVWITIRFHAITTDPKPPTGIDSRLTETPIITTHDADPGVGNLEILLGNIVIGTPSQTEAIQKSVLKLGIGGTITGFGIVPIGSIIAWHKSFPNSPPLPDGWVECNGQVLNDSNSVFDGQTIPNLHGAGHFLRGSSVSGVLQSDALRTHNHGAGSYQAASAGNHTHPANTSVDNDDLGSHAHTASTIIASDGSHTHSITFSDPTGTLNPIATLRVGAGTDDDVFHDTNAAGSHPHTATTTVSPEPLGAHNHLASTTITNAGNHTHSITGTSASSGDPETRPANMSIVWIMRVK
jgi:hypothetical protein